jgi:simple sugar transport system permease protein
MNQATWNRSGLKRSLLSIAIGMIVAGLLIQLSGYNALTAYGALWTGATGLQAGPAMGPSDITVGTGHLDLFQLAQSLATITPLLLCGLAVALGLRAGLFNIGAQGQMTAGALAAACAGLIGSTGHGGLPAFIHVPLIIAVGGIAGAVWGGLAGFLKAWRGVHEVISTIMLNFIGLDLATYLVSHNLRDPHSQNLQTTTIAPSALLSPLVAHSNLTIGLFLAIAAAIGLNFLISKTSTGFSIRAVGNNPEAAEANGISTARTLVFTMALSGGLAGIAGALEVMGVHHRYVDGLAGSYGFDGIAVALLAGLSGGGAILSAIFFGLLASGSDSMQATTSVPAPVAVVVQAIVIIFVGIRQFGFGQFTKRPDPGPSTPGDPPVGSESADSAPTLEERSAANAGN